jgi:hypothetical protein
LKSPAAVFAAHALASCTAATRPRSGQCVAVGSQCLLAADS